MSYTSEYPGGAFGAPPPLGAAPGDRPTRWTRSAWFVNGLAVLILLGVWQYFTSTNERVPAIGEMASFLATEIRGGTHAGAISGEFWPTLWESVQRYLIGLAIGLPLGTVLGLLIGASSKLRALLNDTVLVLLVLPSVVWAFAASLWFGSGSTAPIVAVVLVAVPFMAFNLKQGIALIDPSLSEMSSSYNVPARRRLAHLLIGGALPSAVTGVRLAFMASWNSLLIVEWFGATSGVGFRARFWYDAQRFEGFVAWILLFVVFITVFDWLVLRRWERRLGRWQQQPTLTFAEDEIT